MRALLLISIAVLIPGCPADDACGPGDAVGDGLLLSGGGISLRYHDLVASPNNDCPDASAPEGVVSLTITGLQSGGSDAITFCVPRPDLLGDPQPLGTAVLIIDAGATADSCTYVRNTTVAPSGTVNAEGLCEAGTDPAGFALVAAGQISLDRTCGATQDTVRLDLTGVVSVATP